MTDSIKLPNQSFPTTTGDINLAEVNSEWLIVYFYPKDSTPGCTTQAVDFSCIQDQFTEQGATIFGISRDSVKSHQNFTEKQALKIELISDKDEVLCQHFDVIKEKNMYGKKVIGIERSTLFSITASSLKNIVKSKPRGMQNKSLLI